MKEIWTVVITIIVLCLIAGITATAIEFFHKVWIHVNQPPTKTAELYAENCTFTGVAGIDGGKVAEDIKFRVKEGKDE